MSINSVIRVTEDSARAECVTDHEHVVVSSHIFIFHSSDENDQDAHNVTLLTVLR